MLLCCCCCCRRRRHCCFAPAVYCPNKQSCSCTAGMHRSTLHFSSRMSSGWLLTGQSMAMRASS